MNHRTHAARRSLPVLALGALGVVYGDIGTSPLYAFRECLHGPGRPVPTPDAIYGIVSLIVWSLVLVISVKYLGVVMRADNRGEGGIIALMALLRGTTTPRGERRDTSLVVLGLLGAALLYGDGMITPAITVLSAVEGLHVVTPVLTPYVVPLTLLILFALFLVQRHGTTTIGFVFGPVMVLWFGTIAVLGAWSVLQEPWILIAVDPRWAVRFLAGHGITGFLVLGWVFLVVTGGEALYADMGHFGKRPIRLAWFAFVFPALLVNYFGQGALLLRDPSASDNPFFRMAPSTLLLPLVAISTVAAVIASQALISGAFSLTRQASLLGYFPRVEIRHTSASHIGQIYVPRVNWVLLVAACGLVLGFGTSSRLASAYGLAVIANMVITTVLIALLMRRLWSWNRWLVGAFVIVFLSIDLAFLGSNVTKIAEGGWFPLLVAAAGFTLMSTWRRGRLILAERLRERIVEFESLLEEVATSPPARVPGTAVYMTASPQGVPPALLQNLRHNKVLHERVILLTVVMERLPRIDPRRKVRIEDLGNGFYRVVARSGFVEDPDVPAILDICASQGLEANLDDTTFFLAREFLMPSKRPGMAIWRERLFAVLSRNAERATTAFRLPPERVVELGSQIEL